MKQKTNNNLKGFFYSTDQIDKLLEALKRKKNTKLGVTVTGMGWRFVYKKLTKVRYEQYFEEDMTIIDLFFLFLFTLKLLW